MATILESTAAFDARALEHGLTEDQLGRLKHKGLNNLSKLAFAISTPGTSPDDESLKTLVHDDPDMVTVGQLASIRRLMFDAQTLCAAQVKHILAGTEAARTAELVPAERAQRIEEQRARLAGVELTGPLECSHQSYDYVAKMIEANVPHYLEPHRFTTRSSEVSKEKPGKELILDHSQLMVKDSERKDRCTLSNDLQVFQALTRRSLACDLMGVCSFKTMERWHRFLMDATQVSAPGGYKAPTTEQILRADRAAWVRMAEGVSSLKRRADGILPLDVALDALRTDPTVVFHMMPLPLQANTKPDKTHDKPSGPRPPPKKDQPSNKTSKGGKGKGKGRGKAARGRMPQELVGLHQNLKNGKRICYNFNLDKGCAYAEAGKDCMKGGHYCMRCLGTHPAYECPSKPNA
jgi:hypothetical protein